MRVLVTGGAGFIGSHLVDAYCARGDEVLIIDDLSSGSEANLSSAFKRDAKLEAISLLDSRLSQILQSFKPDLINHHAAQKSVRDSVKDPEADCNINILGLLRLLSAARETDCKKVLFASTGGAIYGEQDYFPADESHRLRPLSPYGISKLASEHYLRFFCQQHGFAATALRYSNVYGPRQDPEGEAGVVAIFCSRLLTKQNLTIFGSGDQTRDFVYVSDVVEANLAAGEFLNSYQEINIATGIEKSVNQLAKSLLSTSGAHSEIQYERRRPGEQDRSVLSFKKARQVLSWQPKIEFEEGLQKTFKWFQENQN